MKKILFLLLIFFSLSHSQQQQINWLEVHNLSMQGISELYNVNTAKANEIFNKIINMAPGDPRGYFFNCMLYYFRYTLERNQSDFDNFFSSSDKVIETCEGLISRNKYDYTSRFYLAGIYGYRGLMYQINNSIVKAVWDGKKGFGMLKDLVEEKPDYYDAYLGTGLFDYLLARIPSGYAWILKILGYSGDKDLGIKELKMAEQNGTYTRTEAALYLSQFLYWEKRYEEAFYYIKKLITQYPENPLFLAQYANMEANIGKYEYAIKASKKAIEITSRKKVSTADEIAYLVLASSLFAVDDFKGAADNYEIYIKKSSNPNIIRNYNYYRMGVCFDFIGQREKAIKAYKLCKKVEKTEWNDDALMFQISLYFISNPPDEYYKKLIMAGNLLNRKKYDEAISEYKSLLNNARLDNEEKIIACINMGSCFYEKNLFKESIEAYNEGLKYQPTIRTHLTPQLYFKKGQSLIKMERTSEAKANLDKALDFDDYYYQKGIKETIKEELKKIK